MKSRIPKYISKARIAVIDGYRTPFIKAGGSLKSTTAVELGVALTSEISTKYPFIRKHISEFITGNVSQPANSANISRIIAIHSGIDKSIPAFTVHRNCASGMEATAQAVTKIRANEGHLYYCLGVESMSNIPLLFKKETQTIFENIFKSRTLKEKLLNILKFRPHNFAPEIALKMGLTDPVCNLIMGLTAENIANDFSISRKEQDEFSARSHNLAELASENGIFADEIKPIFSKDLNTILTQDDGIRKNQTQQALSKLKPFFEKNNGSVTVGNSSQVTDGACGLILASEEFTNKLGIKPLGYIKDFTFAGCENSRMGLGPVFSTNKILKNNGMSLNDFDIIELNEAFASQAIGCIKAMDSQDFFNKNLSGNQKLGEIDINKLNLNGGAIALGHPVGATGTRIILHTLKELKRRNLQNGLATLCIGGGQGGTFLLESK